MEFNRRAFLRGALAGLAVAAAKPSLGLPRVPPPKGGIYFDTATKTIEHVGDGKVSLQALYSFAKEEWMNKRHLTQHPFPIMAITPESMELQNGWRVRDGHWIHNCFLRDPVNECSWVDMIGLGHSDDLDATRVVVERDGLPDMEMLPTFNEVLRVDESMRYLRMTVSRRSISGGYEKAGTLTLADLDIPSGNLQNVGCPIRYPRL